MVESQYIWQCQERVGKDKGAFDTSQKRSTRNWVEHTGEGT